MVKSQRKKRVTYSHNARFVRRSKIGSRGLSVLNVTSYVAFGSVAVLALIFLATAFNFFELLPSNNKTALAESPVVPQQFTFTDDFDNGNILGWQPVDEGPSNATSNWTVSAEGFLQQDRSIVSGNNSRGAIDKPGTYLLSGKANWADYEYSVRVKSTDNDAIGVMFRYQNKDNYYRFSMDKEQNYQRLVKKVNGRYTLLAENNNSYNTGQWYTLKVRAIGNNIRIYIDGNQVFNVNDGQLPTGKIALYNRDQQNAHYDDVKVNVTTDSFTIAVLPDTQYYSESFPEIFAKQTEWLATERAKQNIAFVLHEGDVTQNNTAPEWRRALNSMKLLHGKLPYAIIPGNHDKGTDFFNQYFPVSRYAGSPTFGGTYQTARLQNSYHLFSAGGIDWLVIGLDFGPTDDTLAWANNVAASYPNRHVMVLTHAYLAGDNSLHGSSTTHDQVPSYPRNNGVGIWKKLVKKQPNIQFVFSGHVVSPDGVGRRITTGENGNPVYQMLANYQSFGSRAGQVGVNGGNGYLRLLTFNPAADTVEVKTYSPTLDKYLVDPQNQFTLTGVKL